MHRTKPRHELIPATPSPREAAPLIEGRHPAPMLTFLATAANIGFLIFFTALHPPSWKGLPNDRAECFLAVLFPLFGAGFPLLLEFLFRRQRLNLALRIAWNDLEDLVFEHVSCMALWYGHALQKTGTPPGYGDFLELSRGFGDDLDEALSVLPALLRLELRRDLEKLCVPALLWSRLGEGKHRGCARWEDELIYRELDRRYAVRLRPDLTHTIIAVVVANLVGWWLVW